ncbi:MAG: Sua5/YciO/YrdC/YwlC family protein [Gemmataceae bacterium]
MPELLDWRRVGQPELVARFVASTLRRGGVVGLPTEASYVAAANGLHPDAVGRLRAAVGAAALEVAVAGAAAARDWLPGLGGAGRRLADRVWPGPVVLVSGEGSATGWRHGCRPPFATRSRPATGCGCAIPPIRRSTTWCGGCPARSSSPRCRPAAARRSLSGICWKMAARASTWCSTTVPAAIASRPPASRPTAISGRWRARGRCRPARSPLAWRGGSCSSAPATPAAARWRRRSASGGWPIGWAARWTSCQCVASWWRRPEWRRRTGCRRRPRRWRSRARWASNLDRHRSQPLTPELARQADHLLLMTAGHARALADAWPAEAARAELLSPTGDDIPDPIGAPLEIYEACARQLEYCIDAFLARVLTDADQARR